MNIVSKVKDAYDWSVPHSYSKGDIHWNRQPESINIMYDNNHLQKVLYTDPLNMLSMPYLLYEAKELKSGEQTVSGIKYDIVDTKIVKDLRWQFIDGLNATDISVAFYAKTCVDKNYLYLYPRVFELSLLFAGKKVIPFWLSKTLNDKGYIDSFAVPYLTNEDGTIINPFKIYADIKGIEFRESKYNYSYYYKNNSNVLFNIIESLNANKWDVFLDFYNKLGNSPLAIVSVSRMDEYFLNITKDVILSNITNMVNVVTNDNLIELQELYMELESTILDLNDPSRGKMVKLDDSKLASKHGMNGPHSFRNRPKQ